MALPPIPIRTLLEEADLVIVATVVRVIERRNDAPISDLPVTYSDRGTAAGSERCLLQIDRILRGVEDQREIEVLKPIAQYTLEVGDHGPFFLGTTQDGYVLLGRYGPTIWTIDAVAAALE